MDYEIIKIHLYLGNNYIDTKEARFYSNGKLEYFPEPEYDDEEDLDEQVSEKDEEEIRCMTS
ncbi:hypothetical protein [Neobacillus bataviensis]|uniref:hypothetical protein n=1 Tax=Neobacillus bataviensis TaxID=220685 RepID=UPI001CBB58B0|nr:hypothetical protein [Neobacillus bataviensis]